MSEKSAVEREHIAKSAWQALNLIDTVVQRDMHGDVDGIDTIDAGLRAMASALTQMFDIPVPEGLPAVYLEDVLDYLATAELVDPRMSRVTRKLKKDLTDAMYHGLSDDDIAQTNERRGELYDALVDLLEGHAQ